MIKYDKITNRALHRAVIEHFPDLQNFTDTILQEIQKDILLEMLKEDCDFWARGINIHW